MVLGMVEVVPSSEDALYAQRNRQEKELSSTALRL